MSRNPSALGESNLGWTFKVDHVTTLDTPHSGAYIPQAIFQVFSRFHHVNDGARAGYRAVTSTAAQQMLMIPFSAEFDATHATWQSYYAKVQNVIRNSSIPFVGAVYGSWTGTPQYRTDWWISQYRNLDWNPRSMAFNADMRLYTQPPPGGTVAYIRFDPAGPVNESKYYNAYPGNWPIVENLPGGYLNLWGQLATNLGAAQPTFSNVSFVPAFSAAGVSFDYFRQLPENERVSLDKLNQGAPFANSWVSPLTKILTNNSGSNWPHSSVAFQREIGDELESVFWDHLYQWSPWTSRDEPTSGGDNEHRVFMENIPCQNPVKVQCRRRYVGLDWTGNVRERFTPARLKTAATASTRTNLMASVTTMKSASVVLCNG